jgi:class 3 adenylate cyclase
VSACRRILVVDDTPQNVKLLVDLLSVRDYDVTTATSGPEALASIRREPPDLVLLDVMMPGMSGYEVCQTLRDQPETALLPIVLVTALDPDQERLKGIEAGADDFLSKPFNTAELLARVRSLLRIRELHEQLAEWNRTLERRVEEQVEKLTRLERLRKFFAPQVADLIANGGEHLLAPHRRRITVVFLDLRGFTSFAERAEPEEMMDVLREYYAAMGDLVTLHDGTLERFTGDGLMVLFNDPVEVPDPELRAVRMALGMRTKFAGHRERWLRRGHDLGLGIGIEVGYATLGVIGYEGRFDYSASGTVCNQAARLCSAAADGQVLVSERLLAEVEDAVESEAIGEIELKGIGRPVATHNVLRLRPGGA